MHRIYFHKFLNVVDCICPLLFVVLDVHCTCLEYSYCTSARLFKLKYSHFGRFSNWLCSVIDCYRLDTLLLCVLAGCALIAQRQRRRGSSTQVCSMCDFIIFAKQTTFGRNELERNDLMRTGFGRNDLLAIPIFTLILLSHDRNMAD